MRAASLVVVIVIVLPLVLGQFWAYQLGLYALYAAAAVGVGLCWGQAGFLPLGQALFFGLAAYLSGLAFIAFRDIRSLLISRCRSLRWSQDCWPMQSALSCFAAPARAAPISR